MYTYIFTLHNRTFSIICNLVYACKYTCVSIRTYIYTYFYDIYIHIYFRYSLLDIACHSKLYIATCIHGKGTTRKRAS